MTKPNFLTYCELLEFERMHPPYSTNQCSKLKTPTLTFISRSFPYFIEENVPENIVMIYEQKQSKF